MIRLPAISRDQPFEVVEETQTQPALTQANFQAGEPTFGGFTNAGHAPHDDFSAMDPNETDREISPEDLEVLAELDQLRNQRTTWGATLGILLVSLFLYIGAAGFDDIWHSIIILVPVLGFHELGHYMTMRFFGYRNLRMFFIPFFGAAVSGRHYNIEGWKKVLVALAGPIPGIALGVPVAVTGLILKEPKVVEVANYLLVVNGFNLLPFLPLDGGWAVHSILFVRHPVIDVLFRVIAALIVIGIALLVNAWLLLLVAVSMLAATPLAWRLARIAFRLRQAGPVPRSLDAESIPDEAALKILREVRGASSENASPKLLAQHVANVFETLNADPPGVVASIFLLLVHAGGFVLAMVTGVVVLVLQHRPG